MKLLKLFSVMACALLLHGEMLSMNSSDIEAQTDRHTSLQKSLLRSIGVEEQTESGSCCDKLADKLCPYQERETMIRLLKEHYRIPAKLSALSFFRAALVGSEVLVKLAPVATSALSLYFGLNNQPIPGFVSTLSTAIVIPFKNFIDESIAWVENKHRDALLQEIDFLAIREFGVLGTREAFMNLLLNKNKLKEQYGSYMLIE